jgi:carboxymethylenebutenolidase
MTAIHDLHSKDGFTFAVHHELARGHASGGIVLLPEVYGLTPYIKTIATKYAAHGFDVLVPALLDRSQRNLQVGYDAPGIAKAHGLAHYLGVEKPLLDITAAVEYVATKHKSVALVGYSWGASLAYLAGCNLKNIACVVGYYGADIANYSTEGIRVPTLLHFARHDHNIPINDVEYIQRRNPEAQIEIYEAKAGFTAHDRPALFDTECTKQADERTLSFLKAHLQGKKTESRRRA